MLCGGKDVLVVMYFGLTVSLCRSGGHSWTQWTSCVSETELCKEVAPVSTVWCSRSNYLNSLLTQVICCPCWCASVMTRVYLLFIFTHLNPSVLDSSGFFCPFLKRHQSVELLLCYFCICWKKMKSYLNGNDVTSCVVSSVSKECRVGEKPKGGDGTQDGEPQWMHGS